MHTDTDNFPAALPPLIGAAPLIRRAFNGEDLRPLGAQLLERVQSNPGDAHACLDLSIVLLLIGRHDDALAVQAEAIAMQPLYLLPAAHAEPGLRLLVIMGPGDLMANTPIEFLVEDSDVELQLLYLTADGPLPESVPDHDVMLVGVGESDANQPLLALLGEVVAHWPRPVINHPRGIALLSRDGVCAALRGVAGLDVPVTLRVERAELTELATGVRTIETFLPDGGFPVIVRPRGSHAGTDLERLAGPAELAAYLERVGGDAFFLARFVDYRSADGLFRKYRVALIEGRPYLCHFAISQHWMIHYLNAGMTESAAKRAEEAACMAGFDDGLARRHAQALAAIAQRLGLAYLGIDCAETPAGELLIFEIDNAMVVHAMDSEELFPYKKPAMRKVFAAFRRMLEDARTAAPAA
jgi:glutathione synthase/RimK-type ligase-like ATP-grasp enzyme